MWETCRAETKKNEQLHDLIINFSKKCIEILHGQKIFSPKLTCYKMAFCVRKSNNFMVETFKTFRNQTLKKNKLIFSSFFDILCPSKNHLYKLYD